MSAPSNGSSGASVLVLILLIALIVSPMPARSSSQSGAFLEVHPDTVQPGFKVGLRASCDDDDVRSATVRSPAFGEVTVRSDRGKQLTGSATVPHTTEPGRYRVELHCPDGDKAHTDLVVAADGARTGRGPDTGGGGTAGEPDPTAGEPDRSAGPLLLAGAGVAALTLGGWLFTRRKRQAG